ncbi:hypothetical protein C8K18_10418 [Paraburkholderia sp. GV068]|jgi:hypothetical protein|nr:hypothetical protein C8K19_10418 [Paraburkholderia sp. GV072]PUB05927.1 hypothetical protein C8K18_10418 [Paraburkholderia sp. GV068]
MIVRVIIIRFGANYYSPQADSKQENKDDLGSLRVGGSLVQARGHNWAPLIFQHLIKPE